MAKFSELLKNGLVPSESDWVQYLKEAHAVAPGMTPNAFSAHRTSAGKNSYEILAEMLSRGDEPPRVAVDLACGDGHLISHLLPRVNGNDGGVIGIDMSDSELQKARTSYAGARTSFYCAEARELPLDSESVDAMVCHMAFMLMTPIEPVVREITRVLKPGAWFSAVVGGEVGAGLFQEIRRRSSRKIRTRFPRLQDAVTGDSRVTHVEGWQELFLAGASVFVPLIDEQNFSLEIKTSPDGIWEFMKDMYFVNLLSREERAELKSEWLELGNAEKDSSGKVSFEFPMKRLSVQKARSSG